MKGLDMGTLVLCLALTGATGFQPRITTGSRRFHHPNIHGTVTHNKEQIIVTKREWSTLHVLPEALSNLPHFPGMQQQDLSSFSSLASTFRTFLLAALGIGVVGAGVMLKAATPVVPDPTLLENKTTATEDLPPLDVWLSSSESNGKVDPEATPSDSETNDELTQKRVLSIEQGKVEAVVFSTANPTPEALSVPQPANDTVVATSKRTTADGDATDAEWIVENASDDAAVTKPITEVAVPIDSPVKPLEASTTAPAEAKDNLSQNVQVIADKDKPKEDDQLRVSLAAVEDPPSMEGSDPPVFAPTSTETPDSTFSPSKVEEGSSMDSVPAENDIVPSSSSTAKKDNPVQKQRTKQFQENIHLISTLQDGALTMDETKDALAEAVDIDEELDDAAKEAPTLSSTVESLLDTVVDKEASHGVALTELLADPADTKQKLPLMAKENGGEPSLSEAATPTVLSASASNIDIKPQVTLMTDTEKQADSPTETELKPNDEVFDAKKQTRPTDETLPPEPTKEAGSERLFPTQATGDELTEKIRQHIQREAAKTTRELWRRKDMKTREASLEPARPGKNTMFSTRKEAAESDQLLVSLPNKATGRGAVSVKHLPRKPKESKHSVPSEPKVRLPAKRSSKLFRRPSEAAREAAKKSSLAMSLGKSKLINVSKRTPMSRLPIRSSNPTKVMLTVLLVLSFQRLFASLIRRFFI